MRDMKMFFFSILGLLLAFVDSETCPYLDGAPTVEAIIPSFQHTLKFLNVDATVYRQTLPSDSLPRLRIIRYSSTPVIDFDSASNEIFISSEGEKCSKLSGGAMVKTSGSALFLSTLLVAANTPHGFQNLGFAAMAFMGMLAFKVDAAETEECTPSMQIVIEAPPYYLGSVAECLAESKDPDHCPDPFPKFATCEDLAPTCKLAVIGAGTGGLYTAMRLVEEGVYKGEDVCVFEATERVGGRIYSLRGFGPDNDITVDAGAYRTWPQFTPTTHALITTKLGFEMECYEDEDPCLKYNIVGDTGEKIGFASFVEKMMEILIDEGACLFTRHELFSVEADSADGEKKLNFANGVHGTAEQVIMNVPQRPLLKIMRKSDLPLTDEQEEEILDSLHSVQTEIGTKLYLYYEDAWWYNLGLTNGEFALSGDARNMLLQGRYHDGHVKCTNDGCHGFLLADYVHDFSGDQSQFFRRYQRDRPEPVTIISNTDVEGASFLQHAHNRLEEFHIYENANANYTGFQASTVFANTDPPLFAVLATWNIGAFGSGAAWHGWTDLENLETALMPMNDIGIHVINEAYSKLQGWAEGPLMLADEVLEEYFGVDRPWEFEAPDYVQFVRQTTAQTCQEVEEEGTSGGDTSGGGGGGGGTVDLCFTGNALVTLFDGTQIPIDSVQEGDIVATGFNGRGGRVTEVLTHVLKTSVPVEVVSISTPHGELIGTPSHPIYVNGKWMEMQEAILDNSLGFEAKVLKKKVDVFYNLEVDGDKPGESSHSYVVNGVIASGLGDNQVLNTLFPRQNEWKSSPYAHVDI